MMAINVGIFTDSLFSAYDLSAALFIIIHYYTFYSESCNFDLKEARFHNNTYIMFSVHQSYYNMTHSIIITVSYTHLTLPTIYSV